MNDNAAALGFLKSSDLGNIFDLTAILNQALQSGSAGGVVVTAEIELERPTGPMAAVDIADVSKTFGNGRSSVTVLDHIRLDVAPGEFVCLLGASGCGKRTLLNVIAGLDQPSSGQVNVRAARTGLMFQEAALLPWLTARGNVELALKFSGVGRRERHTRTDQLLDMVHLGEFAKKRPHELSGGMRQRVALARPSLEDAGKCC